MKEVASRSGCRLHQLNWLIYRIHDAALEKALERYASGVLVDIGCGEKPYAAMVRPLVKQHIGVDHIETLHAMHNVDVIGTAYDTTLSNDSADTVLCTAVLEHLERPSEAICEMYRILKPGGHVILSAPLFWHIHEAPRDFYRFTKYGLQYIFETNGFNILELNPLSGFIVTFSQELTYFLNKFHRRPLRWLVKGVQFTIQWIAYQLNRWDRSESFTWLYLVIARKPLVNDHRTNRNE